MGHKEAGCFKKHPEKAPAWYKEKTTKSEMASLNIEALLKSLIPGKLGTDVPVNKVVTHWQ